MFLSVLAFDGTLVTAADGAVPGWVRVNAPGFGNPANEIVTSLAPFGDQLYASAGGETAVAQVYRRGNGLAWTTVVSDGFGSPNNYSIGHLIAFNGQLYAGTENAMDGAQIWRSPNGTNWTPVVTRGFGSAGNAEIARFAVFGGRLYAATTSYTTTHGLQIYRSTTGNPGDWTRIDQPNSFGDVTNVSAPALEVFGNYLYVGVENFSYISFTSTGAEVWRTSNGTTWSKVNNDGFGTPSNTGVSALAVFNGYLYASTMGAAGHGAEVWRCQTCSAQRDWTKVVDNGFGNSATNGMSALEIYRGRLYFIVGNKTSGLEVWRTGDGTHWERVSTSGFDSRYNFAPYRDKSVAVFSDFLYVGTWHPGGGEVWMYLPNSVFLPAVKRR